MDSPLYCFCSFYVLYIFLCSLPPRSIFYRPKRAGPRLPRLLRICAGWWQRLILVPDQTGSFPLVCRPSTSSFPVRVFRSRACMRSMPPRLSISPPLWVSSRLSRLPFPKTGPSSSSPRPKAPPQPAAFMAMALRHWVSIPGALLSSLPARTGKPSGRSKRHCAQAPRGSSSVLSPMRSISRKASA